MKWTGCWTWAFCPRDHAHPGGAGQRSGRRCAFRNAGKIGCRDWFCRTRRAAVRISIGNVLKPAESVQLQAFEVPLMHKGNVLRELLYNESGKTLIFARTKRGTERLAKDLMRDGFNAAMIHGDRTQSQRSAAMASFGSRQNPGAGCHRRCARGLHMSDVAHVVNYDPAGDCGGLYPSRGPHGTRRAFRPGNVDRERRRDDRTAAL